MMIREPVFAGRFYADDLKTCRAAIESCLERAAETPTSAEISNAERIIGGVVPHAGWVFSGSVAARVIQAIASRERPQAIVIFGAIHVLHGAIPAIFPSGAWETPLGLATVDDRLSERLLGQTGLLESNPHAHENEHSIEVEIPFIQHMLPNSQIVPIMVPVNDKSAALGRAVGLACKNYGVRATFLCSTDLTHYGPGFRFTPRGVGEAALRWSKEVNDRRMIDLMLEMRADDAVTEAVTQKNACGGGAIAATIAACHAFGATHSHLLEHLSSHEIGRALFNEESTDSVGYAGIVFD